MPVHTLSCDDAISFCVDACWGFAEVDPEGRFTWVNKAYCSILNAPADLIIGTTFGQWTHPEDLEIDEQLALDVKVGNIQSYNLAKRYIQRGSTPKNVRVIWGMLSVSGKWDNQTKNFLGYRVQFQPYQEPPPIALNKAQMKAALEWTTKNWKQIVTAIVVLTSLIFGSSSTLLNILRKAEETKQSVDSVLQPSQSGAQRQP